MSKIIIEPVSKPDTIRAWIAWKLVNLANWIRPGNEAAMAYYMGIMQEAIIEDMMYGRSEIEIKVKKQNPPQQNKEVGKDE